MLISRIYRLFLLAGLLPTFPIQACEARDFLSMPLPSATSWQDAIAVALEKAYEGLEVRSDIGQVSFPSGVVLSLGSDEKREPWERLQNPSIAEQFSQLYPLGPDTVKRKEAWFDPGRARNDAFFRALWFDGELKAASSLVAVEYSGVETKAKFAVTSAHCVAIQLSKALDSIANIGAEMDPFFQSIGGSFNWRKVAGTERLSAHSFGIAVDLNTTLGGYWRWTGAQQGNVGAFESHYPHELVLEMERHGFIWGGKWHHFDGMHFEYRPELILHARLASTL